MLTERSSNINNTHYIIKNTIKFEEKFVTQMEPNKTTDAKYKAEYNSYLVFGSRFDVDKRYEIIDPGTYAFFLFQQDIFPS